MASIHVQKIRLQKEIRGSFKTRNQFITIATKPGRRPGNSFCIATGVSKRTGFFKQSVKPMTVYSDFEGLNAEILVGKKLVNIAIIKLKPGVLSIVVADPSQKYEFYPPQVVIEPVDGKLRIVPYLRLNEYLVEKEAKLNKPQP